EAGHFPERSEPRQPPGHSPGTPSRAADVEPRGSRGPRELPVVRRQDEAGERKGDILGGGEVDGIEGTHDRCHRSCRAGEDPIGERYQGDRPEEPACLALQLLDLRVVDDGSQAGPVDHPPELHEEDPGSARLADPGQRRDGPGPAEQLAQDDARVDERTHRLRLSFASNAVVDFPRYRIARTSTSPNAGAAGSRGRSRTGSSPAMAAGSRYGTRRATGSSRLVTTTS